MDSVGEGSSLDPSVRARDCWLVGVIMGFANFLQLF